MRTDHTNVFFSIAGTRHYLESKVIKYMGYCLGTMAVDDVFPLKLHCCGIKIKLKTKNQYTNLKAF